MWFSRFGLLQQQRFSSAIRCCSASTACCCRLASSILASFALAEALSAANSAEGTLLLLAFCPAET